MLGLSGIAGVATSIAWTLFVIGLILALTFAVFGRCSLPILVIDMWEHAYYLQFRDRKQAWLEAYWQLVDWQEVARRFAITRQTGICV